MFVIEFYHVFFPIPKRPTPKKNNGTENSYLKEKWRETRQIERSLLILTLFVSLGSFCVYLEEIVLFPLFREMFEN